MSYERLFERYLNASSMANHSARAVERYTKLFDQVIGQLESQQGSEELIQQLRATQEEILTEYKSKSLDLKL